MVEPLRPGDPAEISGYVLRGKLGEGGMGSVYLSHTRGGQPVALKVIRREFAQDPEFLRRLDGTRTAGGPRPVRTPPSGRRPLARPARRDGTALPRVLGVVVPQRNIRIAPQVLLLHAPCRRVDHDVLALDVHPHRRHLRHAVRPDRREMPEVRREEPLAHMPVHLAVHALAAFRSARPGRPDVILATAPGAYQVIVGNTGHTAETGCSYNL